MARRLAERHLWSLAVVATILGLPAVVSNSFQRNLLDTVAITAILSMSYNVVLGAAGQISLSHNAFYALGGYVTAIGITQWGLSQGIAILISLVACALAALVVGVPTLRLRGNYLAVATLALSLISGVVLTQWRPVTGGVDGLGGFGRLRLLGWELKPAAYTYVILVVAIAVYWILENILRSPAGRAIVAVRDHEGAAMALGMNAARQKITALVLSAVFAGVAGNLYAFRERYLNPLTFGLELAFLLLFMGVIGGLGSTAGAAIGAIVVVLLPEVLSGMGSELYFLLYGVITILVILFLPSGLAGLPALLRRQATTPAPAPAGGARPAPALGGASVLGCPDGVVQAPGSPAAGAILQVEGVVRRFGGITAVNGATFSVQRGSITALIGPNGAGKSTLFHLISGATKPNEGRVVFDGNEITGLPPHLVAQRGLIRTYQTVSLFSEITVYQNLLTGYNRRHRAGLLDSALRLPRFRAEEAAGHRVATEWLEAFGLMPWRDVPASALPFGLQRSVETARAMVAGPKLLLLDEPAAGLNDQEIDLFKHILRHLRARGVTILLIEHNLPLVTDVSDRVVVLNFGEVIAEGTPEEVQANPEVVAAYVGAPAEGEEHSAASS